VMFAGKVAGEVAPDTPEGEIGLLMAGITQDGAGRKGKAA